MRREFSGLANLQASLHSGPNRRRGPRETPKEQNRNVIPEGPDVFKLRGEIAFEIVFDDKDSEEAGIAARAKNIPRESREAECEDGGGMQQAEGVTPAPREERPEKHCAAAKDERSGSLCERGEPKETAKEDRADQSRRGRARMGLAGRGANRNGSRRELEKNSCADHGNREHRGKRHVHHGVMRKGDHGDRDRKEKEHPPDGSRAIKAQREPRQREGGE